MLTNPWTADPDAPPVLSEAPVPPAIAAWVRSRLGREVARGFGYLSWAFLGHQAVLRVDPIAGRPGRFRSDAAVSGLSLPGVAVPEVLDSGQIEGRAWIETSRLSGRPAYEIWLDLDSASRRRFLDRLVDALRVFHEHRPDPALLPQLHASWRAHVESPARDALRAAERSLPASYAERAGRAFDTWLPMLAQRPRVLTHGDLWLGNLLADERGRLCGLLDFDRMALAPADYELDMLVRFWHYPWNFVPADWGEAYAGTLDFDDLTEIVRCCAPGLSADELAARLAALELAYRLGKVARFGWSETMRGMLDTVLDGRWSTPLRIR